MFTRRFTGPFLLCLMLAPGCISQDRHVFPSTVFQPATVSVRDIVSQKILWKKDIPVGYELVLNFQGRHEITGVSVSRLPAKRMKWHIRKINSFYKIVERGRMDLSGMPVGIAWSQRPGPEAPQTSLRSLTNPKPHF